MTPGGRTAAAGGREGADRARAARRAALLDDAVACVRRDGPFVTMEQLAAACGVTKPILYRHFGDRDGLVTAMAERFVTQLEAALAPAMSAGTDTTRDLLASTIDAYLALVERDTHLYRFLTSQTGSDRQDLVASIVAELASVVVAGRLVDAGLDPRPARTWSYGLVGMVHFAGDWWVDHREDPDLGAPMDRAELGGHLMALSWEGLASLGLDDGRRPGPADPTAHATSSTRPKPPTHQERDR